MEIQLPNVSQLSQEKDLISSIKIDEIDFTVSLLNASNQNILVEHLSAGERQLLATSILWGFAKAAEGNFQLLNAHWQIRLDK